MQSHVRCRRTHKCMHITCQACAPLASTALSVAQRMWPDRCWVPALCSRLHWSTSARGGRALPNCSTTCSASSSATSWKFFTDARVTRPPKLRQNAPSASFQRGALLRSTVMRPASSPRRCLAPAAAGSGHYTERACAPPAQLRKHARARACSVAAQWGAIVGGRCERGLVHGHGRTLTHCSAPALGGQPRGRACRACRREGRRRRAGRPRAARRRPGAAAALSCAAGPWRPAGAAGMPRPPAPRARARLASRSVAEHLGCELGLCWYATAASSMRARPRLAPRGVAECLGQGLVWYATAATSVRARPPGPAQRRQVSKVRVRLVRHGCLLCARAPAWPSRSIADFLSIG